MQMFAPTRPKATLLATNESVTYELLKPYPELLGARHFPRCPSGRRCPTYELLPTTCDRQDLEDWITHLNDDHQWDRLRIADWVEEVLSS